MRLDVEAFTQQAGAERLLTSLVPGGSALSQGIAEGTRWVVRPDIEVRSSGALTLRTDWSLPAAESASGGQTVRAGGAALTLRAGSAVSLLGGIDSGFVPPGGAPEAARSAWVPSDRASGAVRIAAGADLTAANPLATLGGAAPGGASLVIGDPADQGAFQLPDVRLRSSTGRIALAAAQDIRLAHRGAAVLTTGVAAAGLPAGFPDPRPLGQFIGLVPTSTQEFLLPYLEDGGSLAIEAGRDITGANLAAGRPPLITDWWWRTADPGGEFGNVAVWWSRTDRFSAGVGTLGGGDVTVRAGRDIVDFSAAAANSGWMPLAGRPEAPPLQRFGGGSLDVRAGGDVRSGSYFAAGPSLVLRADGSIGATAAVAASATTPAQPAGIAPEIVYQDTQISVAARGDAALQRIRDAGYTAPATVNSSGNLVLDGLGRQAGLRAGSVGGNLVFAGAGQLDLGAELFSDAGWLVLGQVIPGRALFTAPSGDVSLTGAAIQRPGTDGSLSLLAQGSVSFQDLTVGAAGPVLPAAATGSEAGGQSALAGVFSADTGGAARTLDTGRREPVRLAAEQGDIVVGGALRSARPLALTAGRDIAFVAQGQLSVQQQPSRLDGATPAAVSELTALQAGRDITAAAPSVGGAAGIVLAGTGDLVLVAGRDVNLGASTGINATGNQSNSALLPSRGADITVVAGYRFGDSDVGRAVAGSYAVTGSRGLVGRPGALYAWLDAGDDAIASTAASAFEDGPLQARLEAVQTLLGADHDAYLARYLRTALALSMQPDKARATVAELQPALQADARWQPLVERLQQAEASTRPALALQALRLGDVRGNLEISIYLRAVLAQTLDSGNARATLASLGDALQGGAVGAVLGYAFEARPQADRDRFVSRQVQQLSALTAAEREPLAGTAAAATLRNAIDLAAYLERTVQVRTTPADAVQALRAQPLARQLPWLRRVLRSEIESAGNAAAQQAGEAFDAANALGYLSLDTLFPWTEAAGASGSARGNGDIRTPTSQIRTAQQGDITLLAPSGGVDAGELVPGAVVKGPGQLGIVTVAGGDIFSVVRDNLEVNQSRVFTLARGDIVLWSSDGNLDAGRGAKTVRGAPAPVLTVDASGNLVLDTSGSFSGSGISTLDANSKVALFAPRGEVNAGEAGIASAGNITIAAARVIGADNIASGGAYSGTRAEAPSGGTTAALAGLGQSAATAATAATAGESTEEDERRKRRRRNLFLDFLGLSSGD